MTTPQSELKRLADSINRLTDSFDSDEDGIDFRMCMNHIDIDVKHLSRRMDKLQDQMSLIIKILSKLNVG